MLSMVMVVVDGGAVASGGSPVSMRLTGIIFRALPRSLVVPASVANLGSGFDTLGVAVQLYLRLRIVDVRNDEGAKLTVVRSTPPVRGRNAIELEEYLRPVSRGP